METPMPAPEAEHTPTPWRIVEEDRVVYIDTVAPGDPHWAIAVPQGPNAEANARLIVEAVNAHARLLAENERLRAHLAKMIVLLENTCPASYVEKKAIDQARSALEPEGRG